MSSAELAQRVVKIEAQNKTAADDTMNLFHYFSERITLVISCKSYAKQMIHMKCQALFSLKENTPKNQNINSICDKHLSYTTDPEQSPIILAVRHFFFR